MDKEKLELCKKILNLAKNARFNNVSLEGMLDSINAVKDFAEMIRLAEEKKDADK